MKELKNKLLLSIDPLDVPKEMLKYFEITKKFQELFISNIEEVGGRTTQLKKAKYNWVTHVKRMIEQDDVTIEELKEVYFFLRGHKFWTKNILSTEKLRNQFDNLHIQLKTEEKKGNKMPNEWSQAYQNSLKTSEELQAYWKNLRKHGYELIRVRNNTGFANKWVKK